MIAKILLGMMVWGRNTGYYSDLEEGLSIDTGSIVTMLMEVSVQPGPTAV